jgi:hypothetical protein
MLYNYNYQPSKLEAYLYTKNIQFVPLSKRFKISV